VDLRFAFRGSAKPNQAKSELAWEPGRQHGLCATRIDALRPVLEQVDARGPGTGDASSRPPARAASRRGFEQLPTSNFDAGRTIGHLTDACLFQLTSSAGLLDLRSDHRTILPPERSGRVLLRAAIEFRSCVPLRHPACASGWRGEWQNGRATKRA